MKRTSTFGIILILFLNVRSFGQNGVGIPSLKITPGARQAGMAGTSAGIGDDIYTLYSNPGGLGNIRRWQWAFGYNRWFGDVYQADVSFAKQVRMWGSMKSGFGLFASTVGMPAWDATGGLEAPVSAEHWTVGFAAGQRLDWLNPSLAAGMNIKMIHNRLESYSSTGPAFDAGLLFKPGRFPLGSFGWGVFDYGIFSAGVSVLNMGPSVVYISERTLLPTAFRAGGSLHLGRYDGLSWLLAADWMDIRGGNSQMSAGTEIWWRNFIGCRAGYRADGKDLGDFSLGFGLRWENAVASLFGLPSRFGDAFQADFAEAGYGEVLKQTYRGAVTHYPIAPEPFELGEPQERKSESVGGIHFVHLEWENSFDPDPFDDVRYFLMVDPDKSKIESVLRRIDRDKNNVSASIAAAREELFFTAEIQSTSYTVPVQHGGIYHWAVAAIDLAGHAQLAKKGRENIGRFIVAVPDLVVHSIQFSPSQKITTAPEQGTLLIQVSNQGSAASGPFAVRVQAKLLSKNAAVPEENRTIFTGSVFNLEVEGDTTLSVIWQTSQPGWYDLQAAADPDSAIVEYREDNNAASLRAATVPKGKVRAADSVEVMMTGYDTAEIPMVPEVYFAPYSSVVDSVFFRFKGVYPPLLRTLAERLNSNPDVHMKIYGSIDQLSRETDPALAEARAEAVRSILEGFGIPADRLEIVKEHPNKILGRRTMPANPQDAEWVMQQNRVVSFSVQKEKEEALFQPYRFAVDTTMRDSVQFQISVVSPAGINQWDLKSASSILDVNKRGTALEENHSGNFSWKGTDQGKVVVASNRWVPYALILTDTLGRSFSTDFNYIYIQEKRTVRRQELFGAAKFAQVEPVFAFYWDRVLEVTREMVQDPDLKLRFEGHACAIGPDMVNNKLSLERAKAFAQAFLDRAKKAYPLEYQSIAKRIAAPIGFGEKEPLAVNIKNSGEVLLGDNQSPIGRYLNRRIAILLYREN